MPPVGTSLEVRATSVLSNSVLVLSLAVVTVSLLKYGIRIASAFPIFFEAAQNWMDPTAGPLASRPNQDYVLANALPALVLGAAHLTNTYVFAFIWVLVAFVVLVSPLLASSVRNHQHRRVLLALVVVGGPLAPLMLHQIGNYDAVFCLGVVLGVLSRRPWLSLIGWTVAGFQQSSIAVLSLTILLVYLAMMRAGWKSALRPALGIGLGWTASQVWVVVLGLKSTRLDVYLAYPPERYWNDLVAGLPVSLFGILGILWVVLLDRRVRSLASTKAVLGLALVSGLVLPMVALDQSRVPALAMLPAVLLWATTLDQHVGPRAVASLARRYWIAAAIVPVVMVYEGSIMDFGWNLLLSFRGSLPGINA